MSEDARGLIARTVTGLLEEVPALKPLKLVARIELIGRGDVQQFRLELPDVTVTKDIAVDAKVTVEMRREEFNKLVDGGHLADWHDALDTGRVKVTGIQQYLQLIAQVVERQEERTRTKRARG
ncbi:unannotated protein [freshwater metagenome]|uniref:Unannotated protein n=1 Tax=freshwater metagenome TaxID=449393 RepID=A0A6J7HCY1_9ZZZZ|nr:hypothetical protein [Actinomycetota bacterium]